MNMPGFLWAVSMVICSCYINKKHYGCPATWNEIWANVFITCLGIAPFTAILFFYLEPIKPLCESQ
jgi:hypothetical protein